MLKIIISVLLIAIISVSVSNIYSAFAQGDNNSTSNLPNIDAQTIYEQKTAVLGSDIKNFVILIPNEGHESTNQPKEQYPLANQPYIPQTITAAKGTSITWLNGDVDHDHTVKFRTPNPQNLETTDSFTTSEYTTVNLNQTGQYSYYEDDVNSEDKAFVMEGTINIVDSNDKTILNNGSNTLPINTVGILMVPSKDSQSISSTLESEGITILSDYTFTDLRGGQKGTGPTQTILVWGTQNDNIDQTLSPVISILNELPYS